MPSTDPWNGAIVSNCRDRVAWKDVPQKYKDALEERSATAHARTYTDKHGRTKVEEADRCYKILIKNIGPWVDSGFQQGPNFELHSNEGNYKKVTMENTRRKAEGLPPKHRRGGTRNKEKANPEAGMTKAPKRGRDPADEASSKRPCQETELMVPSFKLMLMLAPPAPRRSMRLSRWPCAGAAA
mmetsp:Transcript_15748/g.36679  ORF Transcript_15748/g.36679 Transcript_15748/m.36679 type:complete len:184 (-) Transcript_15748:88-639(-)